ncbi:MAG TPA: DUF86 domain-containing protein [Acidimicrobiia bacterium]|nr:DUF86 domain-containing protein [Acidimicrobiia bacterium]
MMLHSPDEANLYSALKAARKIKKKVESISFQDFDSNPDIQDIVHWNLMVMGEALNRMSTKWAEDNTHISIRQIIGLRNRIVHGYDVINTDVIYKTLVDDIPPFIDQVSKLFDEKDDKKPGRS